MAVSSLEATPRFSVVTVNYRSRGDVEGLVDSLRPFACIREIVCVNHSPSENLRFGSEPGRLRVVEQENRGYAAGLNRGVSELGVGDGFVLFCNPDVRIPCERALRDAGGYLMRNDRVACLIPWMVNERGDPNHPCRRFYTPATLAGARVPWPGGRWPEFMARHFYADDSRDAPFEVDWGCGGAMLFRRCLFPSPLHFDERFFMYLEDADICAQTWAAGWSVVCYPQWVVIHAAKKRSHRNLGHFARHVLSMARFMAKYRGLPDRRHLVDSPRGRG